MDASVVRAARTVDNTGSDAALLRGLQDLFTRLNDSDNGEGDIATIYANLVKKVIMGGQKDYKIDITLKRDKLESATSNHGMISLSKESTVLKADSDVLNVVTLRDRQLIEKLLGRGIKVRLKKTVLNTAIQHLYSNNVEQAKLAVFLSFDLL